MLFKILAFIVAAVPIILFVFGFAGWLGSIIGGRMSDRLGAGRTLSASLAALGSTYLLFGFSGLAGRIRSGKAAKHITGPRMCQFTLPLCDGQNKARIHDARRNRHHRAALVPDTARGR